ncbi:LysR family transcriptional regulator [Paraburkholderia sp. J12]|uniref:LysR family transcriptional regulator n=1 Tax=Paraburkholderia sp. J12 TaxID=2805432 RepID=UPI002ABE7967|nr:LysR family transcriptional regulator [Paraburkholderia sp. J12]
MNINTVDLNLFLVFRAIYVTRSVTQAGDSLNMTQSAVSNALKRLRERFDDPLFVRTPSGMEPTPMAREIIDLVEEGIEKFTRAIDQARRFEPAQSDRRFRLAMNDIGQFVLMPGLLSAAHGIAPGVRFETVGASSAEEARDLLIEGKIDVAIGSWPLFGQGFCRAKMCDETFVVVLGAGHEIVSETLSTEEYLAAEHLTYRPSGASDAALQQTLFAHGLLAQRKVVLTAAHSLGLDRVVASSRLLLTVPSRLARAMVEANAGLRLAHLPFAVTPFQIWMQWHERFDSDSGNRWLRTLTEAVFHSLPLPIVA